MENNLEIRETKKEYPVNESVRSQERIFVRRLIMLAVLSLFFWLMPDDVLVSGVLSLPDGDIVLFEQSLLYGEISCW